MSTGKKKKTNQLKKKGRSDKNKKAQEKRQTRRQRKRKNEKRTKMGRDETNILMITFSNIPIYEEEFTKILNI